MTAEFLAQSEPSTFLKLNPYEVKIHELRSNIKPVKGEVIAAALSLDPQDHEQALRLKTLINGYRIKLARIGIVALNVGVYSEPEYIWGNESDTDAILARYKKRKRASTRTSERTSDHMTSHSVFKSTEVVAGIEMFPDVPGSEFTGYKGERKDSDFDGDIRKAIARLRGANSQD